jgi:hypothetical protein
MDLPSFHKCGMALAIPPEEYNQPNRFRYERDSDLGLLKDVSPEASPVCNRPDRDPLVGTGDDVWNGLASSRRLLCRHLSVMPSGHRAVDGRHSHMVGSGAHRLRA